jgi:hypothetical protein
MSETVLVCGSRGWDSYSSIRDYLAAFVDRGGVSIIHGAANGADSFVGGACIELGLTCYAFPPDYKAFGKDAPHVRNDLMLKNADRVVAFWDGKSPGTASVVAKARKLGIPVEVIT